MELLPATSIGNPSVPLLAQKTKKVETEANQHSALLRQLQKLQQERVGDAHAIGQLEGQLAEVGRELNRLVEENLNLQINLMQWQRGSVLAMLGFCAMLLLALVLIIILR